MNQNQGNIGKYRACSGATRVQNTTDATVVKGKNGILQRVVVANANAAKQALTIATGGWSHVVQVPAQTTLSLIYGATFTTSLTVTPGSTDLDALVVYD